MMPESASKAAEELGRTYGTLLENQTWDVDMPTALESPPTTRKPEPVAPAAPPTLVRVVEALLFIGGAPLTAARACESVRGLNASQFAEAIETLNLEYRRQGRPYTIQSQAQGFVLTLRPRYKSVTTKLYGTTREARLSPAAIDVLSLVAYRQPATKPEIDSLRGAESGSVLRQLVRRGLVAIVHRGDSAQKEVSYGTTQRFLELFHLNSLEDLPQTQDLQRL